jgi:putative transposase
MQRLHDAYREAYGTRRLHRELRIRGERCNKHRVARLKRAMDLWTKRRRRFVLTTKARPGHARFENVLRISNQSAGASKNL